MTITPVEHHELTGFDGYDGLVTLASVFLDTVVPEQSPEFLYETLLQAYTSVERDDLATVLMQFHTTHGDTVRALAAEYHSNAPDYVAHRDHLYVTPEFMMIAERAIQRPALLMNSVRNSDFEALVMPMAEAMYRLSRAENRDTTWL